MNILLVEDDYNISSGLCYYFNNNNLKLDYKSNIKEAKEYINLFTPSIIILDITLPDGNGFYFFKDYIKKLNIPTIFLTAKDNEDDIVSCLDEGAEDYITKPFLNRELLARVNRVIRKINKSNIIKIKDLTFDLDKMIVLKNNNEVKLTALEYKILELLILNINKVVTRNYIIDKIWQLTGNDVNDNTVTVYLKRIRDKIGGNVIKTINGIGYRIDEE